MDKKTHSTDLSIEDQVARARVGNRNALEYVISAVQKDVYRLALRFLWHPQDAEDATQEILIRIVTGLGSFRSESSFQTWVYSVASNTLLTLGKKRMEQRSVTFEEFSDDLAHGLSNDSLNINYDQEEQLLLEEVKIGCTMGMLLCLDRNLRISYILGEIIELDHNEAAEVLEITPAAFRKRLSRARESITKFMNSNCGLVNPNNACRCRRRVKTATELGRIDPSNLLFASSLEKARQFPKVLDKIRELEETRRAAALYKSHPEPNASENFVTWIRKVIDKTSELH